MKNSLHSRRHNPNRFSDMYELGKKLGEGNFAVVHEAVSKKDQASRAKEEGEKKKKKKRKKSSSCPCCRLSLLSS
jgi:serine/threonine protein kinase